MSHSKGRLVVPALIVALILPLAGCSTSSDPLATTLTSPGQYELYDCPAIKVAAVDVANRQRTLEGLMARAGAGTGGGLVNATTYEPEYITMRGKMSQLRRVAAEKHCDFVPGMPTMPTTTQNQLPPPPGRSGGAAATGGATR